MTKIISLVLGLLGLFLEVTAQENSNVFLANNLIKTEIVDFAIDSICERKQSIKVAKTIKLTILVQADSILLSNKSNFADAKWQKAETILYWQMIPKLNQNFYFQLKFANNDKTQVYCNNPNRQEWHCFQDSKLLINTHAEYTTQTEVTLDIFSLNAKYMLIGNDSIFENSKWQPYSTQVLWKLDENNGLKRVYIKFRDSIHNTNKILSDEIILDTEPPQNCKIRFLTRKESRKIFHKIDTNAIYVACQADDAYLLRIGTLENIDTQKWQKLQNYIAIENKKNGKQTICVQFRDYAGNKSEILQLVHK
jgi:hypothetical protein